MVSANNRADLFSASAAVLFVRCTSARTREFESRVVESSVFESKNEATESLTEELCGGYLFIKAARALRF